MATQISIDLGSYKTVIAEGSRIVLEQPSMVTVDVDSFNPLYFGDKAKSSLGRTPETLTCVRPIEHGVIADYDLTFAMLSEYMKRSFGTKVMRPSVIACLPTGLTELQHHSLADVIVDAGGRNVTVVETPLAVAIGLGIDFDSPKGSMVVDIGAGTTDVASISLGGIVQCGSFNIASYDFDDAIIKYVRRAYNIEIGELTAENIKKQIGSVVKRDIEITIIAKGRNLRTGLPEAFEITSREIYDTVYDTAIQICNSVRKVIEKTDPDIVADVMENGIYLTGGGSLINGMASFMEDFIGAKIIQAADPIHTVTKGMAIAQKNTKLLKNIDYQLRSIKELIIE